MYTFSSGNKLFSLFNEVAMLRELSTANNYKKMLNMNNVKNVFNLSLFMILI